MKISKSILQAVVVGLAVGSTPSCSFLVDSEDSTLPAGIEEECTLDKDGNPKVNDGSDHDYYCPPCGRG